ncbi:hypothetical protein DV737_g3487, partial [Chaetothyriales sp. CBS 132003]
MPSFAIEVEGEVSPLTRETVLSTIQQASNPTATQQSLIAASQQLSNWEKTPGFYFLLQDLYADFTLPLQVRHLAIIQLKNGIDKYWRKASTNAIAKDEKDRIKTRAVEAGVQEPAPSLALQNALLLAKIVRSEFPNDWPDAVAMLVRHLRTAAENATDYAYTSNVLVITLHVIKELAAGRLTRTKRSLQQIAPELLHVLGGLYVGLVEAWTALGNPDVAALARNSHSALKTLRRLLVVGFEHPHREDDVRQFWQLLQQHDEHFRTLISATSAGEREAMAFKHLIQLSKLYLEMARHHPASFVLLDSMQILDRSWNTIKSTDAKQSLVTKPDWAVYRNGDGNEEDPRDKLALKALLLFRACVKMVFNPVQTFKYQTAQDKEDRNAATSQIKNNVLTNDLVLGLMEVLVTQYFVLRPADLRNWEQEPDEWERREEEIADAWEFSIRSCSEKLFLDLVINFKDLLVPRLIQVFQQHANVSNTDIFLKDSLYSAVGIAAACLDDVLDFNSFLINTLVPEVQLTHPHYNLLRRRTAILLGQWVPIKPDSLNRKAIYQIFAHLLNKDDPVNDHVVRVTAGRQLRLVLEPFEFRYADFEPYVTPLLSSVMTLTSETDLSETKMALLETVRVAVTQLEGHIEPYADGIMSMLPPLWAESGEEHLMKQAILTMITAIVNSLGKRSYSYHSPILPLIHDSIQPKSESIVYLLEEALELWAAVLTQTPSDNPPPSKELLSLTGDLLPLLDMGSEHLRQVFELTESYTILSPSTILAPTFLGPLLASMKALLPVLASSRARDASLAPHVLENLAATLSVTCYFTPDTSAQAIEHLLTSMLHSGYLSALLEIIKAAYDYHQDPRPNRKPPEVIGPAETSLFTMLSRLALAAPSLFIEAIAATGQSVDWLITEWLAHFDSIGDILRKKLCTLAVTALLTATTPAPVFMLDNLQSLLTTWTDVITELAHDATEEARGDYLYYARPATEPEWPDATPDDGRKRVVSNEDPIYATNIRLFVAEKLQQTMQTWPGGVEAFELEWLSRIDAAVLKAFVDLKIL